MSESRSVMSGSLRPYGLNCPWNSPGQNTGVGSLSLLQGIFPTQGLEPGLLHCRRILYQLSHREALSTCNNAALHFTTILFQQPALLCMGEQTQVWLGNGKTHSWGTRKVLAGKASSNLGTESLTEPSRDRGEDMGRSVPGRGNNI